MAAQSLLFDFKSNKEKLRSSLIFTPFLIHLPMVFNKVVKGIFVVCLL
jgi:hypothetical protein